MDENLLVLETALQIRKPIEEVFEAIVDPSKMAHYFISKSNGRMEQEKTLEWEFPEFDLSFPVRISTINKPTYILYYWDSSEGD